MSDDPRRRPLSGGTFGLPTPPPTTEEAAPEAPAAPAELPAWLKLPDNRPATLLPPWPDELVMKPVKNSALAWADRLSLPLRYKKTLLFRFARYTGVRFTGEDMAALEDFVAPRPTGT